MYKSISLSEYVRKRNGVALGASGSMGNMLKRSLGANSFHLFWKYWNPIWGYFLSRNVMRPVNKVLPLWLAIIVTFGVSGALHDLAVSLIKLRFTFFFTPWFLLMGFVVLITSKFGISYQEYKWPIRAAINSLFIVICLIGAITLKQIYA